MRYSKIQTENNMRNKTEKTNDNKIQFYPRVINLTNITFTDDENEPLQKGLKYNIHLKPKQWIKTLKNNKLTRVSHRQCIGKSKVFGFLLV
jgi:hypothetical protein